MLDQLQFWWGHVQEAWQDMPSIFKAYLALVCTVALSILCYSVSHRMGTHSKTLSAILKWIGIAGMLMSLILIAIGLYQVGWREITIEGNTYGPIGRVLLIFVGLLGVSLVFALYLGLPIYAGFRITRSIMQRDSSFLVKVLTVLFGILCSIFLIFLWGVIWLRIGGL